MPAEGNADIGLLQPIAKSSIEAGMDPIILVKDVNPFSARTLYARIPVGGKAEVSVLSEYPHTASAKFHHNVLELVGG